VCEGGDLGEPGGFVAEWEVRSSVDEEVVPESEVVAGEWGGG
jgi:hypothetical protein